MKSRKTIAIQNLIKSINYNLARTDRYATKDYKRGLCDALESALHATGNYNGYGYIDNNDIKLDTLGYYSRFYYTPRFIKAFSIPKK